jgi:hypothetical protein
MSKKEKLEAKIRHNSRNVSLDEISSENAALIA